MTGIRQLLLIVAIVCIGVAFVLSPAIRDRLVLFAAALIAFALAV